MSRPLVSICIPTYERLQYLQQAVDSAQRQTLSAIEILIGDDGNSAALRAWAEARSRDDARVKYTKNARRLGLAANWEACAQRANGEYVSFIGDDDRLLPTFAERLLSGGAGCDVIFCDLHVIDAQGGRSETETRAMHRRYRRNELPPGPVHEPERWVWRNSVPMSSALIRRDVALRFGFKHDLNTPEIEMFARLAQAGGTFHFVPEFLAEYRSHSQSLTAGGLRLERLVEYLEIIDVGPEAEPDKEALLADFSVAGVHRLLLAGDGHGAAALCRSPYYPRRLTADRALVQRCCVLLPQTGPYVYGTLFRTSKSLLRRLKSGA